MRLVSGGAVLLILLGTVLIPCDDLVDPLRASGVPYLPEHLLLAFSFMLIYHCSSPHLEILRHSHSDSPALFVGVV